MRKQRATESLVIGAMLTAMCLCANAQTTLVDENFQVPLFSNGTSSPGFTNWTYEGSVKSVRDDVRGDGLPGDSSVSPDPNQTLHFEYAGSGNVAKYSLSHNWSTNDIYVLKVNAAPQNWSKAGQRYIRPSLVQQDGTELWAPGENLTYPDKTAIPVGVSFGDSTWQAEPELNFNFVIDAGTFTAGTPGQPIAVWIATSGQRGTYADNVSLTVGSEPVDNTAPTPNPPTWEVEPFVENFTSITMTADPVGDDFYGVEYCFTNTVAGTSSGWQYSRTWTETGLDYDTLYTYQVMARDTSPNQNVTDWSTPASATTPPQDSDPPTPDPLTWSIVPTVGDYGYITMTVNPASDVSGVEYQFTNTVNGTSSGWQDSTTWNQGGLDHDTLYSYRAKARDKSPNVNESTTWSTEESATTPAVPDGTLVITRFQCPWYGDNTTLQSGDFAGWDCFNGPKTRVSPSNGLPQDEDAPGNNQGIQFEYNNRELQYKISHNWSATDVYTLTINAAPQDWNKASQRYIRPSLRQHDGTELWAPGENLTDPDKTALPKDVSFGSSTWQAEPDLNFTFTINAGTFTAGTEGQPIALRIDSSGQQRGIYVDNVFFGLAQPLPPEGALLIVR